MRKLYKAITLPAIVLVAALSLPGCLGIFKTSGTDDQRPLLLLLALAGASSGAQDPATPGLEIGVPADLDGDGDTEGTPVDTDGDGNPDGIDVDGDGVPELILIDTNGDGIADAIDQDGDGNPDYYICYEGGQITITTAPDCGGSAVDIVDEDGDGVPDGVDTDGDGNVDDGKLGDINNDTVNPTIALSGAGPGAYGSAQNVTLTCSDDVAPGEIVYTLDGSTPQFDPRNGTLSSPPSATATIGASGDGTYTLQYQCRDAAGNLSSLGSGTYTIDSNIATITFTSACTQYISSGDVSCTWQSDLAATSRRIKIGGSASDCSDGTTPGGSEVTGAVAASTPITTTINNGSLGAGSNVIRFCVPNGAGIYGVASQTSIKDTANPTASIDSPTTSGPHPSGTTFTLSCSDSGAAGCNKIAYTTDGSTPSFTGATIATGTLYGGTTTLPDGSYTLRARAVDNAGNVSTVATQAVDVGPPGAPTSVSATGGEGEATVSWGAVSGASSYTVYYGTSPGLTTSSSNQSAGASTSTTITGLTNGTTYFFAVVASHSGGTGALSSEVSATPMPERIVFLTQGAVTATTFGGLSGANTYCSGDANKPNSSTYRALLWGNSALAASTRYTRADGTLIGTTDAFGDMNLPLSNPMTTAGISIWTGWGGTDTCTDWTSLAGNGKYGRAFRTNSEWVDAGTQCCSPGGLCFTAFYLACVEQ